MDEAKAPAPDKDLPHPFQARPEVPVDYPANPVMFKTAPDARNCTLCGAPRDAPLHVEGKAEANQEAPNWG